MPDRIVDKGIQKFFLYDYYYQVGWKKYVNELQSHGDGRRIVLLMTPDYGNIGDQAIAEATVEFVKDHFPDDEFLELSIEDTQKKLHAVIETSWPDDIFLIQGGGNMGNLYPYIEETRRYCFHHLQGKKVISLPCTMTYTRDRGGRDSFRKSQAVYKNVVLTAREKYSYAAMKKAYPEAETELIPDMVFYLGRKMEPAQQKSRILVCLRAEIESALEPAERTALINQILHKYSDAMLFDTTVWHNVDATTREAEVLSILRTFSRAKLVITDRMHGMIMCAVTNTPCIVLQSRDHKIEGSYEWIKDLPFIQLISKDQLENIPSMISEQLTGQWDEKFQCPDFDKLKQMMDSI